MAKLAGLPNPVLTRARAVLSELESIRPAEAPAEEETLTLTAEQESQIPKKLRQMLEQLKDEDDTAAK